MGKQSHKRRHKSNRKKLNNNAKDEKQSNSLLIQNITHKDVRVRDTSLCALATTLVHPKTTNKINSAVVKSIVEQVSLDKDLSVQQNAAGCLLNLSGWDAKTLFELDFITICFAKLQQELQTLSNKNLMLIKLLLSAACNVIESCNEAVDFISQNVELVNLLTQFLCKDNEVDSISIDNNSNLIEMYIAASRALHALLDGNIVLTTHVLRVNYQPLGSSENFIRLVADRTSDKVFPASARLYCAGILIHCYYEHDTLVSTGATSLVSKQDLLTFIKDYIIPVLLQFIDYRAEIARALVERIVEAEKLLMEEENDLIEEQQAEKSVKDKKESARLIARRLKAEKEEKKKNDKNMEEGNRNDNSNDKNISMEERDKQETCERATSAWKTAIQPVKLALDLTANICAGPSLISSDDGVEYWASDDEDRMEDYAMTAQAAQAALQHQQKLDPLFDAIKSTGLPDKVVTVFSTMKTPLLPENNVLPSVVSTDIIECIGKCAGCIGNMVSNLSITGPQLLALLHALTDSRSHDILLNDISGSADIISASILQLLESSNHEGSETVIKSMGENDLNRCLDLLKSAKSETVRKNGAQLLSVLCCQPHSIEVDRLVGTTLFGSLFTDSSIIVCSALLCAIMDIYGQDEAHHQVFDEVHGLEVLQKFIPVFRRRVKDEFVKLSKTKTNDENEELITMQHELKAEVNETLLNTARFIKYKQQ